MDTENIPINKCIYCGGVGETDEHLFPLSMGGRVKLLRASCNSCRDITQKCERNPINDIWAEARAALHYPSRKRQWSNEAFQYRVTYRDGSSGELELNSKEALGLAPFFEYGPPVFFGTYQYSGGVNLIGIRIIAFGQDLTDLARAKNIKEITATSTHKGCDFERMVINIAYRATVATFGPDSFEDCFVLETILNDKNDVGYWMGCDDAGRIVPIIGRVDGGNVARVGLWGLGEARRVAVCRLKFFSSSEAPEYIVVVGRIKPDYVGLARVET